MKNNPFRVDLSRRLFIELGTSLLIETREKIKSLSSKLIGMKVGNYLIVEISGEKFDVIPLIEKEQVTVKYVNQDNIFSFSSTVLMVLNQPGNLVFLHYPDRVESCNIRSHKRVECFLPVQANARDCQEPGVVTNISAQGCLCLVDHTRQWENINGQAIELVFPYGDAETLCVKGEVRTTQVQGPQIKLGIRFNQMDSFPRSVLAFLVPALRL